MLFLLLRTMDFGTFFIFYSSVHFKVTIAIAPSYYGRIDRKFVLSNLYSESLA